MSKVKPLAGNNARNIRIYCVSLPLLIRV